MHPHVIIKAYRKALKEALDLLDQLNVKVYYYFSLTLLFWVLTFTFNIINLLIKIVINWEKMIYFSDSVYRHFAV